VVNRAEAKLEPPPKKQLLYFINIIQFGMEPQSVDKRIDHEINFNRRIKWHPSLRCPPKHTSQFPLGTTHFAAGHSICSQPHSQSTHKSSALHQAYQGPYIKLPSSASHIHCTATKPKGTGKYQDVASPKFMERTYDVLRTKILPVKVLSHISGKKELNMN